MVDTLFLDEAAYSKIYKVIKKENEWCAVSEDGQRSFGCFPTEEEALERLSQVEAAKSSKGKDAKVEKAKAKELDIHSNPKEDKKKRKKKIFDLLADWVSSDEDADAGSNLIVEEFDFEDWGKYEHLNGIKDVEIFRTGKWNGDVYGTKDLDDMVSAFGRETSGFVPPIKVGHTKESGARAFGWIEAIRREGDKLVADFVDVPDKVFELIKDRSLDTVSAEIFWNLQRGEKKFRRVLKAVALLGAEIPAVSGLAPLRTVVNSQEAETFERVISYELKPFEVRSMDKLDELSAQIEDLETKLSEAEEAKAKVETAEESEEFAEQLEEAVQARDQAEDELKVAKVELDKAYKAKDTQISELTRQVKSLQAAQEAATEEKRIETVERKAEYCKIPALREHIKALYDVVTKTERQVNFTQDGETTEISAEEVVDKLVETINSDATKLFQEISRVESPNRTDTYINAGVEVDKRVREFQMKHTDMSYETAFSTVLAADPELATAYAAA